MKTTITLLLLIFLAGCKDYTRERKSFDIAKMDLGKELWKNKILLFEGNVKKADSAYQVDKIKIIDDIYDSLKQK